MITVEQLREILKAMKEFGVSHLKMGDDVELTLVEMSGEPAKLPDGEPGEISGQPSGPIEHKVEQLTSLLKLNDTELVDQLFPDRTQEAEA